jgi:hypothetical protein
MRQTEGLQETQKMRFEEAYEGWQARRLTQEEAARRLRTLPAAPPSTLKSGQFICVNTL